MSNSFNIDVKPEIAAAVVKIDANKAELDGIRATDIPGTNTKVDANNTILSDLHNTDLPAIDTKVDALGNILVDIHDTDLPAAVTKIDDNKSVLDTILSTLNYVYPSDDVLHTNANEVAIVKTSYYKFKETFVNVDGIIRISFDLKGDTAGNVFGRIYINGIAVGTERSQASNGWSTYTEDLLILKGDAIQIYGYLDTPAYMTHVKNLILKGVLSTSFESIT